MAGITFRNIDKIYGDGVAAVTDFSLEAGDREFVVLAGPDGCGKSTVLRMAAGLEEITKGELLIGGRPANGLAPRDRGVAMMSRNGALYPEMTVFDNLAFGLRLLGVPNDEIVRRVERTARDLELSRILDRKPKAVSAGQRQRVLLGRAAVRSPKVLLLDEPFANLDAKLRARMLSELSELRGRLGAAILYATSDQEEAMAAGDRVAVMKDGVIQQADPPRRLYDAPANRFVASFVGPAPMNFLHGTVERAAAGYVFRFGRYGIPIPDEKNRGDVLGRYAGREAVLGIRPEDIREAPESAGEEAAGAVEAEVELAERAGGETRLSLNCGGVRLAARVGADSEAQPGGRIRAVFGLSRIHLFDKETEKAILN